MKLGINPEQLNTLALWLAAGTNYLFCAWGGLWWLFHTKPLIAGFIILCLFAVSYERGYKDYLRLGFKKIFLMVYILPFSLGLSGFLYGFLQLPN
jgi:hypothetical protein